MRQSLKAGETRGRLEPRRSVSCPPRPGSLLIFVLMRRPRFRDFISDGSWAQAYSAGFSRWWGKDKNLEGAEREWRSAPSSSSYSFSEEESREPRTVWRGVGIGVMPGEPKQTGARVLARTLLDAWSVGRVGRWPSLTHHWRPRTRIKYTRGGTRKIHGCSSKIEGKGDPNDETGKIVGP